MKPRLDVAAVAPSAYTAMLGLEHYIHQSSIERPLMHLVKYRASQMNGCAYCLDMHAKDLRALGETEQRLFVLDAWREAPFYTARERAALAWTEAVTNVQDGHVEDAEYAAARAIFSEGELVDLTMVVVTINAWNRLAIAFRTETGTYAPT